MSDMQLPYAVIGATGRQGAPVVDALLEAGVPVRALVRDPGKPAARELDERGVEVVEADQEDGRALEAALTGVAAMSFYTTFAGADATEGEVRRGTVIADAAARAGVPRVVYSSVGGAERHTGIPHFESKRRVEERLSGLLPVRFVRPAFFMENLAGQLAPGDDGTIVVRMPMPPDVPLQMVATRDIGRAVAALLLDPDAIEGEAIELGGDELTMDEALTRIGELAGRPARFERVPLESLGDDDAETMFRWFWTLPAYEADFAGTRRLVPGVLDLRTWAALRLGG